MPKRTRAFLDMSAGFPPPSWSLSAARRCLQPPEVEGILQEAMQLKKDYWAEMREKAKDAGAFERDFANWADSVSGYLLPHGSTANDQLAERFLVRHTGPAPNDKWLGQFQRWVMFRLFGASKEAREELGLPASMGNGWHLGHMIDKTIKMGDKVLLGVILLHAETIFERYLRNGYNWACPHRDGARSILWLTLLLPIGHRLRERLEKRIRFEITSREKHVLGMLSRFPDDWATRQPLMDKQAFQQLVDPRAWVAAAVKAEPPMQAGAATWVLVRQDHLDMSTEQLQLKGCIPVRDVDHAMEAWGHLETYLRAASAGRIDGPALRTALVPYTCWDDTWQWFTGSMLEALLDPVARGEYELGPFRAARLGMTLLRIAVCAEELSGQFPALQALCFQRRKRLLEKVVARMAEAALARDLQLWEGSGGTAGSMIDFAYSFRALLLADDGLPLDDPARLLRSTAQELLTEAGKEGEPMVNRFYAKKVDGHPVRSNHKFSSLSLLPVSEALRSIMQDSLLQM